MNNTVVLKDRAYVEKKQSKKNMDGQSEKNIFRKTEKTIIAGLLSMNGDVNAYRMLEWKDK